MLGYEDVLNANPGTLAAAATQWRAMADRFHAMEQTMDRDVLSVNRNGLWTGGAASMANFQLIGTKNEIVASQVEAKAIASLLDDAKADFEAAQKQVRDAAKGAADAGFKVTGTGVAVFDMQALDPAVQNAIRHDPEAMRSYQEAAGKWTEAIKAGLQRATDADQRAALALRSASKAGNADNNFNAGALGGGDAADGKRAAELATRIDSLNADELKQLQNLMRANGDSPEFAQTLLDKLGPEGTVKLAEKLNNPGKDDGKKGAYPGLQNDLTRTLAAATKDTDSEFYRKWREGMREQGLKNFGSNTQPVYGYQILTTLMGKGNATYSNGYLTDLGDDIIAAEKKKPGLWSYMASHDGTSLGADPLDELLGVMGRQPDAATAFLDPGANGDNKRLHYLMKDREWPEGYMTGYTMMKMPDPLSQSGLAAAIEAASTGERAGTAHDGKHTEAQARVMHQTITIADENHGADKIKDTLRKPLGNALADYVGDTHELLSGRNDAYAAHKGAWKDGDTVRMTVGEDSLVRFMRGVSEDPAAYAALHRAETGWIAKELSEIPGNPSQNQMRDPMGKGAAALGVFDAIRSDAVIDKRNDENIQAEWKAKGLYHIIGVGVNELPMGSAANRLVDMWTYELQLEQKAENNNAANAKISDTYLAANREMADLVAIWAKDRGQNPDSPDINALQDDMLNNRNRSNDTAGRYLGRGNA